MYNHLKFSTSYNTRVNLHGHCSMCIQFFINFRSHQFLSLSSPCTTTSTTHLLFLKCTQTHPYRKINTEIYLLKKKKKKKIHKHTHTQTNPNEKTKNRQIGAYRNDRSSWVSLDRSSWVWVLPDRSQGDQCLWIGVREN